jgi:nucleotide-binding universal stress UspA family protein
LVIVPGDGATCPRRIVVAVDGVLEVARDLDADLVVIGMQGTSAVSGIRIGGKALQLLHRANVTVAVVPPT